MRLKTCATTPDAAEPPMAEAVALQGAAGVIKATIAPGGRRSIRTE